MITFLRTSLLITLPLLLLACGESGSEPEQFSEVQYRVVQDGGGTFALLSLSAGGFQRRLAANAVYSTQGPVRLMVEGAPGPYSAELCRRSGGDMTVFFTADSSTLPGQVRLTFETAGQSGVCRDLAAACTADPSGASCVSDGNCAAGEVCEKRLAIEYPALSGALASQRFADPDVRFEVCEPSGASPCSVRGEPPTTLFGRVMSGSVGDIASTYLVGDEIPSIYFLNSAKHNVSAIFRAAADEFLQVQLFVNDTLRDTQSGTEDVIIREDL